MSLVGYRWWYAGRWTDDDWRLRSVFHELWWEGPHLVAAAPPRREDAGGIHAFKTWQLALAAPVPVREHLYPVLGAVTLWGGVVEHENGWRAEQAMIRQLRVPERLVVDVYRPPAGFVCGYPSFELLRLQRVPPATSMSGCVTDGDRTWREPPIVLEPDPAMVPALARVYGVDVVIGPPHGESRAHGGRADLSAMLRA